LKSTFDATVLPQLDELIAKYEKIKKRKKFDNWSNIEDDEVSEFLAATVAAIHRTSGASSQFAKQADEIIKQYPGGFRSQAVPHIGGILKSLRHAVASGYLASVQELIHADVFSDFLEMAEHLLGEGYKDPAAVLTGGVLEEHLRKLCSKNGLSTDYKDSKGVSKPKKAESMNTELAGQSVYSKLDQKNVTAWLALRNKAAHGQYSEYTQEQVELLLQNVRDFLVRHPA
jgi:hypothetical protein